MADEHDVSGEPRDAHGRWTAGLSANGVLNGEGESRWFPGGAGADTTPDPRVVDVGGDKWNKDTAARLEKEYADVRPAMDAIAKGAAGQSGRAPEDDGESEPEYGVPDSWDNMSSSQQDDAESEYKKQNYDSEYEHEVSNWHENGDALTDAKHVLAASDDWAHDKMGEFMLNRQEEAKQAAEEGKDPPAHIPYTVEQLSKALSVEYDGYSSEDGPKLAFNDLELEHPETAPDPNQMTFPGIAKPNLSSSLTQAMRDEIKQYFTTEFNSDAESKASDMEAPSYLSDSADESLAESWSSMGDDDKFEWTKHNTSVIPEEAERPAADATVHEPTVYDPLNKDSDTDYKRTQVMSHYLFDHRAQDVLKERGIKLDGADIDRDAIQRADKSMWTDWKGSSTGISGQIMQVASADELGGRLREKQLPDEATLRREYAEYSKDIDAAFGSYEEWKLNYKPPGTKVVSDIKAEKVGDANYVRLPLSIVKNGLSSFTTDPKVANEWGGTGNNAPAGIDKAAVIKSADQNFPSIGGYEGVKALMRAKWETTQYMLDRSGDAVLDVYRGIVLPHSHTFSEHMATNGSATGDGSGTSTSPGIKHPDTGEWIHPGNPYYENYLGVLHDAEAKIKDIGGKAISDKSGSKMKAVLDATAALSDTQKKMIASKYGSIQKAVEGVEPPMKILTSRVVVRAQVPRTAIISVPAYGVNVHSEKEVVVAGTAWKNWEAFSEKAPAYDSVPAHAPASANPEKAHKTYDMAELDKLVSELKNKG